MKSFLAVAAIAGSALAAPVAAPSASIASGAVVGTTTTLPSGSPVNQYLGIPFAASPPLRFAAPEPPAAWSTPLDATALKPACPQQFTSNTTEQLFNNPLGPPPPESEDCLYLNVFAPSSAAPGAGLPVMFWIYGGNLEFGTASIPFYDGSSFAANQGVVVVTINYRTNVFGFSNSPEIPAGQQNAGFLDQRMALDWVQSNIAAFGGDPTQVTIFGESAGGYSVKQLLAIPPSPLPFRAAIMESEAATISSTSSQSWNDLVSAVGCSGASSQLDCVRGVPAETIISVIDQSGDSFSPVFDGVTAIKDFRDPLNDGTAAPVPIFMGTNANEGRIFAYALGIGPDAGEDQVKAFLDSLFPNDPAIVEAVLAFYPTWLTKDAYEFVSQVVTDYLFLCTTRAVSELAQSNGHAVWRYYFNETFPNLASFPDPGVYHSSEIPIVFGTYPTDGATASEVALSQYMQTAWADFAKDPSSGPGWPGIGTNGGVELGDLGGQNPNGETTIDKSDVDDVCLIYGPVIALGPL